MTNECTSCGRRFQTQDDEDECPYCRRRSDSGKVIDSIVIGAVTNSAILGAVLGGSIIGGIVGDSLVED